VDCRSGSLTRESEVVGWEGLKNSEDCKYEDSGSRSRGMRQSLVEMGIDGCFHLHEIRMRRSIKTSGENPGLA
jgi:hypothetical protein